MSGGFLFYAEGAADERCCSPSTKTAQTSNVSGSVMVGAMIVGLAAATVAYAITLLIYRIVSAHPDNGFCRFVLHGGIGSKKDRQAA